MSVMPGRVAKTTNFQKLDTALTADLKNYMKDYGDEAITFSQLLGKAETSGVITKQVRAHIEDHWLCGGYWPLKGVAEVLRRGLYWATRLALYTDGDEKSARATPLKVVSCWICSGGPFEVVNLVSADQVTMLIMTGAPPVADLDTPQGGEQPIWVTRGFDEGRDQYETEIESTDDTRTVRPQG